MVNGPKNIFVERKGNITRANISFEDDEHVLRILDRIVAPLGAVWTKARRWSTPACPTVRA